MKKLFLIITVGVFTAYAAHAQKVENVVLDQVEQMPEFPGGMPAMFEFIGKNLKYPAPAQEAKVEGKVFIKAIVEKDGSIGTTEIVKGIGFGCDKEVDRVVKLMPKWTPGKQDGKVVRASIIIPVSFVLDNKKSK